MKEVLFQEENLSEELIDEVCKYSNAHLREIGGDAEMEPDVWHEFYYAIEKADNLRIYTARNGKLVGYSVYFVSPHRHHKTVLQATSDLMYMDPTARKGLVGMAFLKWCEEQLKDDGVSVIYHFSSSAKDLSPMLGRMGYNEVQTMWVRKLKDGGTN
jgi:hypothetical protein